MAHETEKNNIEVKNLKSLSSWELIIKKRTKAMCESNPMLHTDKSVLEAINKNKAQN